MLKNLINRKFINKLIIKSICEGISDEQVQLRLRACGYTVSLSRIERQRRYLQERGVPV